VFAAYYASDGFDWQQQGDELNRVDVVDDRGVIRIICTAESSGEQLFSCEVYPGMIYEKPSEQFHQWTSEEGEAFGLSFATEEEAHHFAGLVETQLVQIGGGDTTIDLVGGGNDADAEDYSQIGQTESHRAEDTRHWLETLMEIPEPRQFQLVRNSVQGTETAWPRIETLLKMNYPCQLQSNVQMVSMTELAMADDVAVFEDLYKDFSVTDLWLNVEGDQLVEDVSREGFEALGNEKLSFGIPLGCYLLDHDDIRGSGHQMVLCKAAIGRSLPMTEGSLNSLPEAPLPVGYHSLTIPPRDDGSRSTSTFGDIPLGVFEHSFVVPNKNFVLMTHIVTFDVKNTPSTEAEPAMSLFANHPGMLTGQYSEDILAVCDQAYQGEDDITHAVALSYEKMWADLNRMADKQGELQQNLEAFRESIEFYKEGALEHCQQVKADTVAYQGHTIEVHQMVKDFRFEVNRCLSDINRLMELYMHMKHTNSSIQLISKWRHLHNLCEKLKKEVARLCPKPDTPFDERPPVHPHAMALTESNKRIIGLRRECLLRDELISRLANMLQAKGALTPEDEELIALI